MRHTQDNVIYLHGHRMIMYHTVYVTYYMENYSIIIITGLVLPPATDNAGTFHQCQPRHLVFQASILTPSEEKKWRKKGFYLNFFGIASEKNKEKKNLEPRRWSRTGEISHFLRSGYLPKKKIFARRKILAVIKYITR